MKEDLTYIGIVLDASSSMGSVREATIAGFNAFLEEQKKAPGEAILSVAQFADQYHSIINAAPLERCEPLTEQTYKPYGNTALYDAIGLMIDSMGRKLAAMPESQRPARVLVMIQTDGEENASTRYTSLQIRNMIDHQRTKYNWNFLFIGASEESIASAVDVLGMPQNFTAKYTANVLGTRNMLRSASAGVANYRAVAVNAINETYAVQSFMPDSDDSGGST